MKLLGNDKLLKLSKTGFLCSRQIPASVVLKCFDWAIEQRELGNCIVSGFQSQIEKDVLHYLLKGKQPVIVALARGIKKRIEPEFVKPLKEDRLLIVSPFENDITRVTRQTALVRNNLIVELADNIVIGYMSKGGMLESIVRKSPKSFQFIVS